MLSNIVDYCTTKVLVVSYFIIIININIKLAHEINYFHYACYTLELVLCIKLRLV